MVVEFEGFFDIGDIDPFSREIANSEAEYVEAEYLEEEYMKLPEVECLFTKLRTDFDDSDQPSHLTEVHEDSRLPSLPGEDDATSGGCDLSFESSRKTRPELKVTFGGVE